MPITLQDIQRDAAAREGTHHLDQAKALRLVADWALASDEAREWAGMRAEEIENSCPMCEREIDEDYRYCAECGEFV